MVFTDSDYPEEVGDVVQKEVVMVRCWEVKKEKGGLVVGQ